MIRTTSKHGNRLFKRNVELTKLKTMQVIASDKCAKRNQHIEVLLIAEETLSKY